MARWVTRIDIDDLLTEDDSVENAIRVGVSIADRIENVLPAGHLLRDEDMEGILVSLRTIPDCEELNYVLDLLFDWGDFCNRMFVNTIPGLPAGSSTAW